MGFFEMHRNIQIRILTSFLTRIVGSMVFPFMAIYFSSKVGGVLAGGLLLFNTIVSLVISLYGGYIADRVGRKKVLVIGQGLMTLSYIFMAVANSPFLDSVWLTFVMMTLNSVANGLTNPAADAMLVDVSTPENRKVMYSISYWSANLSIMIGAQLGGLLFKTHRFELFLSLTVVSILTFILVTFVMVEAYEVKKVTEKRNVLYDVVLNYRTVMQNKAFMIFILATTFAMSTEFQLNNYIGVRLENEFGSRVVSLFGLNDIPVDGLRMLSFITTENTLLVVCFTLFVTKFIKRFRDDYMLYIGVALYVSGFAITSVSNSMTILLIAALIFTTGELMYVPIRQSLMADTMDENARSSYMAVNGLSFQFAKISGSLGVSLGAIIGSYGMFIVILLLGVISFFLFRKSLALFYKAGVIKDPAA